VGLFDFFFGGTSASNVEFVSVRIWMSQAAKFNGVRKELEERAPSSAAACVLTD
jgi:hypothetical protein